MDFSKLNWYPGHMKKTRELLTEQSKLVDVVIEIIDSRIPLSSKNPDFDAVFANKDRILVFSKSDLSDPEETRRWEQKFRSEQVRTLSVSLLDKDCVKKIVHVLEDVRNKIQQKNQHRILRKKPLRVMVCGVPNTGKSTFINRLKGRKSAQTGNKAGVTKGKQWVKLESGIELLDTPGILWPRIGDEHVAKMLAFTGAIKDELLEFEELAYSLIDWIRSDKNQRIRERYNIEFDQETDTLEILNRIAEARSFIVRGGEIDYLRTGKMVMHEYRSGLLGYMTLEKVEVQGGSDE